MSVESKISNPKPEIKRRPLALVIIDGWGYSPRREGNAIAQAHTPHYDDISARYPKTLLEAAGARVGLPDGASGNSEAGHLNLGAGRVVLSEAARINKSIEDGSFFENPVLTAAIAKAKKSALHLVGLFSDGDVHAAPEHLFALVRMAKRASVERIFVHPILDGRDVQPRTADVYVEALEIKLADIGAGRVASVCGRYYAMDKDRNWQRTARAYTMLACGEGERTTDPVAAIRSVFSRGVADDLVEPIVLESAPGIPVATIKDNDAVIFFNHRADGIRQLVRAFAVSDPEEIGALSKPKADFICLVEYDRAFDLPVAFPSEIKSNVLAQVFAREGVLNCRVAEPEKYAHVTYFFNGGTEAENACEQRVLISSPKAFERQPEMSCFKVTDKLLRGLEAGENDVFVINLAAPDVAAHGGDFDEAVQAVQFVDTCLGGIVRKVRDVGGIALITSDHGNCEEMLDLTTGEPHAGHTRNPVPFHLVDEQANGLRLRTDGALEDVAPTILALLGIERPAEMTGRDLRVDK